MKIEARFQETLRRVKASAKWGDFPWLMFFLEAEARGQWVDGA